MDSKKELLGLRLLLGSFLIEVENTFGTSTVKAILSRMGQKSSTISAESILENNEKEEDQVFESPITAFTLFKKTLTQLYDVDVLEEEELPDRYIIKIKNDCPYRNIMNSREEIEWGGSICEFTMGYFEASLKKLTGLKIDYRIDKEHVIEDGCRVNIVFFKKKEDLAKIEEELENNIKEDVPTSQDTSPETLVNNE